MTLAMRAVPEGQAGSCHQDLGAEIPRDGGDFLGVSEQDDAVRLPDLLGALPDMPDDRLAAEIEQDLARQARRGDAGGDAEGDGEHGIRSGGKLARGQGVMAKLEA